MDQHSVTDEQFDRAMEEWAWAGGARDLKKTIDTYVAQLRGAASAHQRHYAAMKQRIITDVISSEITYVLNTIQSALIGGLDPITRAKLFEIAERTKAEPEAEPNDGKQRCFDCNGKGATGGGTEPPTDGSPPVYGMRRCDTCGGSGRVPKFKFNLDPETKAKLAALAEELTRVK